MADQVFDPDGLDVAADFLRRLRTADSDPVQPKKTRKRKRPPRRKSGDPELLGDAVSAVMDEEGWSKNVNVHVVLSRWAGIVGPSVAAHSKVSGFKDSVVFVVTDSTAWAVQLRSLAPQIVAKLNEALGDGTVSAVDVRGPDAPSWRRGPRSVSDGRGPRDTYG